MSGGSWERMMSNYNKNSEIVNLNNIDSKYYDLYTTDDYSISCNGKPCYGDASFETINWYDNFYENLKTTHPWILRGGNFGGTSAAGAFNIYNSEGQSGNSTFRLVIH